MKLKYEFETVDMGDEIILVPVGEGAKWVHGIIKLNKSGLEIINLMKKCVSEDNVVDALATQYENNRDDLLNYVRCVLKPLRENGLIEE